MNGGDTGREIPSFETLSVDQMSMIAFQETFGEPTLLKDGFGRLFEFNLATQRRFGCRTLPYVEGVLGVPGLESKLGFDTRCQDLGVGERVWMVHTIRGIALIWLNILPPILQIGLEATAVGFILTNRRQSSLSMLSGA